MPSLTLKNVPEPLLRALRRAAEGNRRSLNQQAIHLLSAALVGSATAAPGGTDVTHQLSAWRRLAGKWESDLDPDEEGRRLVAGRSRGRKVAL